VLPFCGPSLAPLAPWPTAPYPDARHRAFRLPSGMARFGAHRNSALQTGSEDGQKRWAAFPVRSWRNEATGRDHWTAAIGHVGQVNLREPAGDASWRRAGQGRTRDFWDDSTPPGFPRGPPRPTQVQSCPLEYVAGRRIIGGSPDRGSGYPIERRKLPCYSLGAKGAKDWSNMR
jgi:hypothetical protein